MSERGRILVDDHPSDGSGAAPWWTLVIAAIVIAATTFALSGREPDDDQAVVQLPVPPAPTSTTTATLASTTTSTEPPLLLHTLVPSFDRTLQAAALTERGLTVTTWEPGAAAVTVEHAVGTVFWADFDAAGALLGAMTYNSSGQGVVWLSSGGTVEPVLIKERLTATAFHATRPSHVAISSSGDAQTSIETYRVSLDEPLELLDIIEMEGQYSLRAWSDEGLLLQDLIEPQLLWVHPDGSTSTFIGYVPDPTGLPVVFEQDTRFTAFELSEKLLEPLPDGTMSLSPLGRYVVIDSVLQRELRDRERSVGFPLADGVSFIADWSSDDRWFVYVSDIESFRQGVLTRLVFVDASNGSNVSVSLPEDRVGRPFRLAVSP